MEVTDAKSLIIWLIEGGGAGIISWWLFDQMVKAKRIKRMKKEWKRFYAIIFAIIIGGIVAYLGSYLGIYPGPADLESWLDLFIKIGLMAATSQQLAHGFTKYTKERK
jgi:hypothetical protein